MEINLDQQPSVDVDRPPVAKTHQNFLGNVKDAIRSSIEAARGNKLLTLAAIGASAITLAGSELAVNTESVAAAVQHSRKHSSKLTFKPGHYEGYTSQTCSSEEASQGICSDGQRMTVSFTATRSEVKNLSGTAIISCQNTSGNATGSLPGIVRNINYAHPVPIIEGGTFAQPNPIDIGSSGIGTDVIVGKIHKQDAHGELSSLIEVNSSGQPDPNGGITCATVYTGDVTWQATRQ